MNDAIGGDAEFAAQFGYHADIVRPFAIENFPPDSESRLVPLDGCPNVFCLDPHDMAVAKFMVGRPKDIALLADLARQHRLDLERMATLRRRTPMTEAHDRQKPPRPGRGELEFGHLVWQQLARQRRAR